MRSGKLFRLEVLVSKRIKHKSPAVCHWLQTTDADLQATDRDALVRMSSLMYLIREFESRLLELKDSDLIMARFTPVSARKRSLLRWQLGCASPI